MNKTNKIDIDIMERSEPTLNDDVTVRMIRSGNSKADKNFLMDDPRFSPEAMEERRNKRSIRNRREWKSEMLQKYGNIERKK